MKPAVVIFTALIVSGCASSQPPEESYTLPQLIEQSALPALPSAMLKPSLDLDMKILVLEDGSVAKVRFVKSSGYGVWDSLAAERIMKWKYSPALLDGKPVTAWIHQRARVEYEEPSHIVLAEIVCARRGQIDSIYIALLAGKNFDSLALWYSIAPSRERHGVIGLVETHRYPQEIHKALDRLQFDQFTKPLQLGQNFVIFKRLAEVDLRKH